MRETSRDRSGLAGVIDGIDAAIGALERLIMALGVILMAVNTIANVISRFVFNHSISYAEELNSIFILLVTFAGLGYAARHGRHIRMSAISDALPFRARKLLMIVITAITASKGRVYPALGMPVYLSYVWVPIGLGVAGIQYALTFLKNLQESDVYLSTNLREEDAQELELEV